MTIQEAIRSGRKFRPPLGVCWFDAIPSSDKPFKCAISFSVNGEKEHVDPYDVISDKWEIEEERIEITKDQLFSAIVKHKFGIDIEGSKTIFVSGTLDELAKELGFKQ